MTDETKKKPATRRPRHMASAPETDNADEAGATKGATNPVSTLVRQKTKASMLEDLLASNDGATLDAMCVATGWLPHTWRAFLTGLRKKGQAIERVKREEGTSVYRFVESEPVAAPHADPAAGAVEGAAA